MPLFSSLDTAMSGKVLISASELSDLMKAEPVVLIDTRDPAIYTEAHIPGAVDIREVFTYLATSTPEGVAALRGNIRSSLRQGRSLVPKRR
jgi:rhodanese-related sulfurtransferase